MNTFMKTTYGVNAAKTQMKLQCNNLKQYLDKSSLLILYDFLTNSYAQFCVISWRRGDTTMIQSRKVSIRVINLTDNKKQKNITFSNSAIC